MLNYVLVCVPLKSDKLRKKYPSRYDFSNLQILQVLYVSVYFLFSFYVNWINGIEATPTHPSGDVFNKLQVSYFM